MQPPDIDQNDQWHLGKSHFHKPGYFVLRNNKEWDTFWHAHKRFGAVKPGEMPEGAMAVVVCLGDRPTAGYRAEVKAVHEDDTTLTLDVAERTVAAGTALRVVTQPLCVKLIPASCKQIKIKKLTSPAPPSIHPKFFD